MSLTLKLLREAGAERRLDESWEPPSRLLHCQRENVLHFKGEPLVRGAARHDNTRRLDRHDVTLWVETPAEIRDSRQPDFLQVLTGLGLVTPDLPSRDTTRTTIKTSFIRTSTMTSSSISFRLT